MRIVLFIISFVVFGCANKGDNRSETQKAIDDTKQRISKIEKALDSVSNSFERDTTLSEKDRRVFMDTSVAFRRAVDNSLYLFKLKSEQEKILDSLLVKQIVE